MNCSEFHELLGEYWDLPLGNLQREAANQHIETCSACRDEFEIWRESMGLIQSSRMDEEKPIDIPFPISRNVMGRIYRDETWRVPVAFRNYTFSYKVRRNIMATVALCLTLFLITFIHTLTSGPATATDFTEYTGIIETAHANAIYMDNRQAMFDGIPVASISAPIVLKMGPIQTYTDYLLAISILGFIFTLLIMNWLSRLRA